MKNHDKDILGDTGPGQPEADRLLVTELLDELRIVAEKRWSEVWSRAITHERMYHSFHVHTDNDYETAESGETKDNLLRTLVSSYASRMNEDLPRSKAFATHPEAQDVVAAELANAVLEHVLREEEIDERNYEFAQNGQLHGTAFWKIYWDITAGDPIIGPLTTDDGRYELDANGEIAQGVLANEGAVKIDITTVFDTAFGPGHRVQDANWCLFRRFVSRDEALQLLDDAGLSQDELPPERQYQHVSDGEAIGYELWEVWYKPGFRFPRGKYCKVLGRQTVLFSGDFPYSHGELPIAPWQPEYVRDRCFGTSHVWTLAPLQRELNHAEDMKRQLMGHGAGIILTVPDELADELEPDSIMMRVTDPNQANMIQYKSVQNFPPLMLQRAAEIRQLMHDAAGQNEVLIGNQNIKSGTSAKAYEFLNNADKKKMAPAMARKRAADRRRDRQVLKLFQEFADTPRKVLVLGPDGENKVELIDRLRVDGTDIVLEPVSGIDDMRSTKAGAAPENAQLGLVNPADVPELSRTGLGGTLMEAQARDRFRAVLREAVLNDQEVVPPADVPPLVALDEISKFEALGVQGSNQAAINRLREHYQMAAAQAAQGGQNGQPQG